MNPPPKLPEGTCQSCHFYSDQGPHCFAHLMSRPQEVEKLKNGLAGLCDDYKALARLNAPEPVTQCPHCGSSKDPWWSRSEPMGYFCEGCGRDVDEPVAGEVWEHPLFISESAYNKAMNAMASARTQLQPDGENCAVCGDTDHQAFECHHNPLVLARKWESATSVYRCFHCGFVAKDEASAIAHFGSKNESRDPSCVPAPPPAGAKGELLGNSEQLETPRTEDELWSPDYTKVDAEFARTLERELAEAKREIEILEVAKRSVNELWIVEYNRNKRLRADLDSARTELNAAGDRIFRMARTNEDYIAASHFKSCAGATPSSEQVTVREALDPAPCSVVMRVTGTDRLEVHEAIEASHPCRMETPESYQADALAMELIHKRHDKREIVNLIRWCLMGCPPPRPESGKTGGEGEL